VRGDVHARADAARLLAAGAVLVSPLCVVWLAGALGGLIAGGRSLAIAPAQAAHVLVRLPAHLGRPEQAWPVSLRSQLPGPLAMQALLAISLVLVVAALALCLTLMAWLARHGSPARRAARFASRGELAELRVRSPLPDRVMLGVHRGGLVAAQERSSVMVVGPSQSGKTSGLVVPAILEWAGPVLSTSIKSDVVHDTHAARSQRGEVRIFDPTLSSGLAHSPWSPVAASRSWEGARRTAARLLSVGERGEARSADEAFWRPAGARYLAPLLLAAAQGERSMRDVLSWIARTEQGKPAELLEACASPGAKPALEALRSVWDADERFRSSLLQTVATALDPWQEPQIAAATAGDSQIGARWLLSGENALYLISPADDQRRLRGLFSALVADITAGAFAESARNGKPVSPALLLALDEVANIAPLPGLDEIASTGPGQGLVLLTVLQNISQAADRWGSARAETIIANHRARLFCSGVGDRATLEYLGHTLGEEEIARVSMHRPGMLHPGARTVSSELRALVPPNRVRQAQADTALLIYGRLAPAWLRLRPWYAQRGLRALASGRTPGPGIARRLRRAVTAPTRTPAGDMS
jgi:type IV secretion system protein VirD4